MTCLKCGRETEQTFCENCREVMARYPVKPGTIILLPKDRTAAYRRAAKRQTTVTAEMQVESQRKVIRRLTRAVIILVLLLLGVLLAMGAVIRGRSGPRVGQNYSTVTKPSEDVPVSDTQLPTEG